MSDTGPLIVSATTGTAFRETGKAAHLRRWLREVRPDLSADASRQVSHYARQFVDLFGAEAPALVAGPAERIRERLDAVDLSQHGLGRHAYRHLLRAGRALHAAAHDLDTERTRWIMDQHTPPQRRQGQAGPGVRDRRPDEPATETRVPPRRPDRTTRLSDDVRAVLTAVRQQVTAQQQLDACADVRRATRAVLSSLSPTARVQLAARLPDATRVPIADRPDPQAPSLTDLADQTIVAFITRQQAFHNA